jgi:T-complex protein 1 subunit theta
MPKNPKNFIVDNVRVCKIPGLSVLHSTVMKGMVFTRTPLGNVKHVQKCKVAVYGCAIDSANTDTTGKVLIQSAEELKNYNNSEEEHMNEIIKAIADSGAKLVVSGNSVGELAAHFIERHGLMCIKIMSKYELRRFCRTVGAIAMTELKAPSQEELGYVFDAREAEIGGTKVTIVEQSEVDASSVATIILRAATTNMLDDVERAIDDGVNCVKCLVRDGRLLNGGGACEIELARRIAQYADTFPGLEQYAIKKYAEALEVVPKTLAENAGLNATEMVSSLYAAHNNGESTFGVDVDNGCAAASTILDVYSTKECAFRLATDAACTILKVDQIIMSKPAGGPKAPQQGARDED